jgi:hypothetical protein
MVEGFGTTFEDKELQHPVQIVQDIARRNAKRTNACLKEPGIAMLIVRRVIAEIVRSAVNLNAQSRLLTIEVEHVRPGGMLSPELQSARPMPEMLP